MYKPRSNLLITKSSLPRLLVEIEVDSTATRENWPPELVRMLLQGAAIVRFANTFLTAFQKDFVLAAIFVWEDGRAPRYALFQEQNYRVVCYTLYMSKLTGQATVDSLQRKGICVGYPSWPS